MNVQTYTALTRTILLAQHYLTLNSLEQSSRVFLKMFLIPSEHMTQGYTTFDAVVPGLHTIIPDCTVGNNDRRDIICGPNKGTRLVGIPEA